ncbi:hypothetical protein [Streptomyces sp. NBC_00996]|uniref:hypothetical protein n=1 Tax=Streptomyces sp. NBC_00996 TaxID=2903710 RepID=UPI00386BD508|nr:hypothetical protein OG390_02695 [Streptomyces sp. NBC_00996]
MIDRNCSSAALPTIASFGHRSRPPITIIIGSQMDFLRPEQRRPDRAVEEVGSDIHFHTIARHVGGGQVLVAAEGAHIRKDAEPLDGKGGNFAG